GRGDHERVEVVARAGHVADGATREPACPADLRPESRAVLRRTVLGARERPRPAFLGLAMGVSPGCVPGGEAEVTYRPRVIACLVEVEGEPRRPFRHVRAEDLFDVLADSLVELA